ncbi:alpha-amylase family glycosyl hydrolase [Nibricoccus sp. IMCC34717]|uniref:alpha-amylase family glycosyl hydrolase n=1 Tax=Nibricoccus sp. IMCC34717 TaxID=3034021 RepID=UPI0038518271
MAHTRCLPRPAPSRLRPRLSQLGVHFVPILLALWLLCLLPLRAETEFPALSHLQARATPDWVRASVVYEIFPRQFSPTGNFAGITARLDDLMALGVNVLWLMPIHPIGKVKVKGSIGSPYAVRDYHAINSDYGTRDDLLALVRGAHARGMKVIIDIVANHTAWDNVLLVKNPRLYAHNGRGEIVSPYDWTDVAKLDYGNADTRAFMRDMLVYWIREYDLDGFRCDVAGEVPTDFWESVRVDLEAIKPGIFLLAEAKKPDLLVKAFDADYAWPMLATLNRVLMEGASAAALRATWENEEQARFPKDALHLRCSDNHDEPRAISRFGWNGALAASALMFTLDGIPLLYNGMEVGDTSESGDPALFERVPIFWKPKQRTHFLDTYRALIALRRSSPVLQHGSLSWLENSAPAAVVSFARTLGTEQVVTVINLSNRPLTTKIALQNPESLTLVLASSAAKPSDATEMHLGAFEWRIYKR